MRNFHSRALVFSLFLTASSLSAAYSQSINANWKSDLNTVLDQYLSCAKSSSDSYTCSSAIAESIAKVYKINGLYSDKTKRYLPLKDVAKQAGEASQWTQIGHAYEQKALDEAQNLANANKAVIAVYTAPDGVNHVALILPGELQFSGTWGFKVPNSASFVLNEPEKSYVGKGLSYAFARNMLKDVVIYTKKY